MIARALDDSGEGTWVSRDHRTTPATQAAHPGQRWAKRDLCVLLPGCDSQPCSYCSSRDPGKEYLMNCSCQESCPCRPLAAQSLALVIAFMSVCAHPCCRQTDRPTISSWTDCQLRCATAIYLMACNAAHVVIPSRSLCHRRSWRAPIHAGWLGHQHTGPQQASAGMTCSKTLVY